MQSTFNLVLQLLVFAIFLKFDAFSSLLHRFPYKLTLRKPNTTQIDNFLVQIEGLPYNHNFPGFSRCVNQSSPDGFVDLSRRTKIGHGALHFNTILDKMVDFKMMDAIHWADIYQRNGHVCTLIRCYGILYALSPCRIVYAEFSKNRKEFQMAYSTLEGHMIAGEERFRLWIDKNDDVYFEIYSSTKGSTVFIDKAMFLIRPLQRFFFDDICSAMKNL